jgi:hypothetical protein
MGKWQAVFTKGVWYASLSKRENGKKKFIRMHRLILPLPTGKITDHRDRNGLNNQRKNLRPATHRQSQANKNISRNNTSGIKGVTRHKAGKKWQVTVCGKYIGLFHTKKEAASAYNRIAIKVFGEFATPNA